MDGKRYFADPSHKALDAHTWDTADGEKISVTELATYGYSTDFNIIKNSDSTKSYQFDHLEIKGGSSAGTYLSLNRTTPLVVDDNIEIIVYYKTEVVKVKAKHITATGDSLAGATAVKTNVTTEDKTIEVEKGSKVTKKNFQQLQASVSFELLEKDGKYYKFKEGKTDLASGPPTFNTISADTLGSSGYEAKADSVVTLIYEETDTVKFKIYYYDGDSDELIKNAKRASGSTLENPKEVDVERDPNLDMSDTALADYLNDSFSNLVDLNDSAVTYEFSNMTWSIGGVQSSSTTLAPPTGKVPDAAMGTVTIKVYYRKSNNPVISVEYVDENGEPLEGTISSTTKMTVKSHSHTIAAGTSLKDDDAAKGYVGEEWKQLKGIGVTYEFDKWYCTIGSNINSYEALISEDNIPNIVFKSSTHFKVVYKSAASNVNIEFVDTDGNSLDGYVSVTDSNVVAKDQTVSNVPDGTKLNASWFNKHDLTPVFDFSH